MFLSRCVITSSKPPDYYKIHQGLWKFFPNYEYLSACKKSPFLYRIENPHKKGYKKILMQSIVEPIPSANFSGEKLIIEQVKEFEKPLNNLSSGQYLKFLVRAYPSKRLKKEGKSTNSGNVRVPLRRDSENDLTKDQVMLQWLKRLMERDDSVSLNMEHCNIRDSFPLRFRKGNHYGTIYTVSFEGSLLLKKPKDFIENIIKQGIGSGKAFGCGMVSISKP